ncbi:MAG TPA: LysM domain-containing protein [Candidatus Limnocylindrales bacterium]|jgi:hypothetical protein|nr:LysM domain-containing protein [Candidatus Limnocylindrales bacterium]
MSDRGLPIVDGAQVCPFVAFEDDRDERAMSPDHRHRCYAEPRPAPRALAHQEAYCLASTFPVCPTFQDWARREAAHARTGSAGVEPLRSQDQPPRNPPRDWSAPPPWAGDAGGAEAAAAGAGSAVGPGLFGDEDESNEAPGFLASRSAAAGAGLAGSAADRWAGEETAGARPVEPERSDRRDILPEPEDDDYDDRGGEVFEDELGDDFDSQPRGRARSERASGGISFGRDRRPRVGDTRRGRGWDEVGPSWERPRHHEPYPPLKSRVGMPSVSRVGAMAIALVLAAIGLFFLPQLLGLGGTTPQTGDRTSAPPGSVGPSVSVEPTPVPPPTPQIYIVKAGDTMSRIATLFGVGLDELIEANRELHPNPDALQIGDEVIIPTTPPDELGGSPEPSPAP